MKLSLIFIVLMASFAVNGSVFDLDLERENPEEKGVFWGPLFSFILPGSNQFYESQNEQGMLYTGIGSASLILSSSIKLDLDDEDYSVKRDFKGLTTQYYLVAGGLSAYASFQSSVKYKKEILGEYKFIEKQETVDEILTAPFEFKYFKRSTTYVPLILVSLLTTPSFKGLNSSNVFLTGARSYNAGVWEEAAYRGWMLPALYENTDSFLLSNSMTSLTFAATHGLNSWPQLIAGYYLGWLVKSNQWSLKEAVFLHVWWDVIAIGSKYMQSGNLDNAVLNIPLYSGTF